MEAGSDEAQGMAGQVLAGRYRLVRPLGQGGMGVVYEATQESLGRAVAVKVIRPGLVTDVEAVTRFRAEAERAGRLNHPHIVQIHDFGAEPGGLAWIAMERLSGEALSARIARGPMNEADVVRIGLEALSALEAAHALRLVHRDLKPDNIFLTDVAGIGDSVKLLDFGIAKLLEGEAAQKLTATGMLIGTPLYMSPEQARGADIDERADLYSLGAVLYEALSGHPPLSGGNYNALLYAILSETPQPMAEVCSGISPALAAVVDRALTKEPNHRFASAREMAEALAAAGGVTLRTPGGAAPGGMRPAGPSTPAAYAPTMATPQPQLDTGAPDAAPMNGAAPTEGRKWYSGWLAIGTLGALGLAVLGLLATRSAPERDPAPMAVASPMAGAAPTVAAEVDVGPRADGAAHGDAGVVEAATQVAPTGPGTPAPAATPATTRGTRPATKQHPGKRRRARRPRPRPAQVRVRHAGGVYAPYGRDERAAVRRTFQTDWSHCWPRGVPAPTVSTGRTFLLDVAADGHVVTARARRPDVAPQAFFRCMTPLLERLTLPPPPTGKAATIQVHFGTSPVRTPSR